MKTSFFALACFGFFLLLGVSRLAFGDPVLDSANHVLDNALNETGSVNYVTSVVLEYRGYDTLGEITVLFTAVTGTFLLMRSVR